MSHFCLQQLYSDQIRAIATHRHDLVQILERWRVRRLVEAVNSQFVVIARQKHFFHRYAVLEKSRQDVALQKDADTFVRLHDNGQQRFAEEARAPASVANCRSTARILFAAVAHYAPAMTQRQLHFSGA